MRHPKVQAVLTDTFISGIFTLARKTDPADHEKKRHELARRISAIQNTLRGTSVDEQAGLIEEICLLYDRYVLLSFPRLACELRIEACTPSRR